MIRAARVWAGIAVLMFPLVAGAQQGWELIQSGPITIRARNRPGTAIREVWAEGDLDAPVKEVQDAILDAEAYPHFMPYVKESRWLNRAEGLVYTRLDLPLISSRDYVVQVIVDAKVTDDGKGAFANRWSAKPDAVPPRSGLIRLRYNDGTWSAEARNGKTHLVYHCAVDPGGWLPAFAADMGNRSGVNDTFRAVEREARRRADEHRRQAQK